MDQHPPSPASFPLTSSLLPTYARVDLSFDTGYGAWLVGRDGRRYLDFGSGVAVNALGHAHPHLVKALTEQAAKIWHTSNLFRIPEGERLAQRLVENTFADVVFFSNSGAEANEAAIKMARRYHASNGLPERFRIITFEGAFHGRTLATLAAGGQARYLEGFSPKVEGFDQVPFGDIEALKAAIAPGTAALMIEPIQGESGVRSASNAFLRELRALCDQHGLLLIFDEVQTGVGRTVKLFAYEWTGVTPDIMAIAKGIGGGFPLGACLATAEAAKGMTLGTHGSTFGGNPLAMAVGNAVLDIILEPGFLENVERIGTLLNEGLVGLREGHPAVIAEIRGYGLMLGLRAHGPSTELITAARDHGLVLIGAGGHVVRLLPPLIIGEAEVAEALARLDAACVGIAGRSPALS